jgi:hypothetical protein
VWLSEAWLSEHSVLALAPALHAVLSLVRVHAVALLQVLVLPVAVVIAVMIAAVLAARMLAMVSWLIVIVVAVV